MQLPPELRGSQQFPAPGLHPLSQHEQQQLTGRPWVGSAQPVNGVLGPFAPPAPVGAVPTLLSAGMALGQDGGGFLAAAPVQPPPQPVVGSPPGPLPVVASPSVQAPWVQTVPQAMPWGTYPATTATGGPLQLMRFSAGDQPTWAVNERRFRKRYLPAFGPEPPRKQAITEEKIAAQLSDLSLDGVLSSPPAPSTSGGKESEEKRLHVLCPELEVAPQPQPLLPQPVLDDLRKRATMAVVLWQPLGPPTADKAGQDKEEDKEDEAGHRETRGEDDEEEASMEL